jgi:hypothetical protein
MVKANPIKDPFYEGDKVQVGYNANARATFKEYCRGYRSHCVVKMDDGSGYKRAKASDLQLIERRPI